MLPKELPLAIRALLLLDDDVAAAVGGERIYPAIIPQGQRLASLVYNEIARAPGDYHMDGPSGLGTSLYQIDAWAQDSDTAANLANLVLAHLHGFADAVAYGTDSPQDEIVIQGIFAQSEGDEYDAAAELFRVRRDYRIVWEEN